MSDKRLFSKTLALLTGREKRRGFLVVLLLMLQAAIETAGVASVMPFLAVLGNPELVHANHRLRWLYERGGFDTADGFLFVLGMGALALVTFSAVFRITATYAVNRFVYMREYTLGARLLETYLRQPYDFFLDRNPFDLSKSLLLEVKQAINLAVKPLLDLVSHGFVAVLLIALLLIIDPVVALAAGAVIATMYAGIYWLIRGLLYRMGVIRFAASRGRFQAAGEAFGGIKDLKVLGREDGYLARFQKPAEKFARYQHLKGTLSAAPKFLMEAAGFGGILVLTLFLMATRGDLGSVLPLLGVYAFAGYRLLPAAQHIFTAFSSLRFGAPAVDALHDDLARRHALSSEIGDNPEPLHRIEEIRFDRVTFMYPGARTAAITDLNLAIKARTSVGFVGRTGAGKTTAVDLLLGLLDPTEGTIWIDGRPLAEIGVRRWQRAIGYVPQNIYLADGTVAENIAFGIDRDNIDMAAVERAAEIAGVHEFVHRLDTRYDTEVGDRGIRLSGGQRQRIGIARALYHDPQVLVFDEATSSVDMKTERLLMDAVETLSSDRTVILIAHRLATVARCDEIVVLEHGRVAGTGTYAQLAETNPVFREIAVVG